ncbi:hypothetical protein BD626DRAFT_523532 [Schizophyllum amplum]|uniref:Uncharacterized protein n=1 Tax=Schizophyllum amplum TaxID=97359 RepID=A0A550BSZ5_9AGAR|nr:hypothetical protein BD626DRAFT_523532 [Auriculariopsis ampla]
MIAAGLGTAQSPYRPGVLVHERLPRGTVLLHSLDRRLDALKHTAVPPPRLARRLTSAS